MLQKGSGKIGVAKRKRVNPSSRFFFWAVAIMVLMALAMPAHAQSLSSGSFSCATIASPADQQRCMDAADAAEGFSYRRIREALTNEPDRARIERRNPHLLWADRDAGSEEISGKMSVWLESKISQVEDEARAGEGDFAGAFDIETTHGVVHLGADILSSDNFIFGALLTYDWAEETADLLGNAQIPAIAQNIESTGWMAGPYISARLGEALFFDLRMAVGGTNNDLSLGLNQREESYDTDRVMAKAALTANRTFGNWRVTPTLAASYMEEDTDAYRLQNGVRVPAQSLSLGRLEFEPEFACRQDLANGGFVEQLISVAAVWDFNVPDGLALQGRSVPTDEFRGRVEGALQVNWQNGNSLRLAASFDGLGASDYSAQSLQAWVDVPFGGATRRAAAKPRPAPSAPLPAPAALSFKECFNGTRVIEDEPCPEPKVAQRSDEDLVFIVLFDHDQSSLLNEEIAKIDRAIAEAQGREIKVALLEGHTDRSGSAAYNEPLSFERAVIVRDALIERGIPAAQITYQFFGERQPAIATPDGQRLRANRRTEVVIQFKK